MTRKDKSLVCGLYNIIDKYLPKLFIMFEGLTDKRQQGKVTYDMKIICVTRLLGLLCGITTMNSLTNKFNNKLTIDTISKITNTKLDDLPHYDTINDVFDDLDIDELRKIQKYIVYTLIRSKMFDRFRYKGKFQLLIDGTGLVSFNHKHCDHCLVKKHSDGHLTYEHNVLEAKLVFDSFVLSIDSEFIENPSPDVINIKKQDCEMNAFKRMATRLKKNFPKLKFIITGDALYASGPFIKLCLDNKWDYIFTFITSLSVTDNNIKKLIDMGRRRWKIENNGFNNQKNILFDITHMCSLDYNAMKVHYLFIQFAHTIRQLLDFGSNLVESFQGKLKEISFAILNELTSSLVNVSLNSNFQLKFDKLII